MSKAMPYIPAMRDYHPFFIQTDDDTTMLDTAYEWGLVAKANLYPALPEMKDPYSNDWDDEDGLDEYLTETHFKEFDTTVSFYVKTISMLDAPAALLLREQVRSFFEKIRSGSFRVYDSYSQVGYQNVRFVKADNEDFLARGDWARMTFEVTFRVNDPVTRMLPYEGSIVEGYHTLTITVEGGEGTVSALYANGVEMDYEDGMSIRVGTEVTYTASMDGYDDVTGTVTVTEDTEIDVSMT